jgi:WD40 repeat protein
MWDTNTWKNTINFNTHHDKDLTQVTFSPDGRNIITASNDTTARIWDVTTGEKIATLYHRAPVKFAGYNPDGNHIITITGKMVIWDTQIVRGGGDFVAKEVDNNK